jgi:hypothetical protein
MMVENKFSGIHFDRDILMHIGMNGWFLSKPYTGIGQYTVNLVRALALQLSENDRITVFLDPGCPTDNLPKVPKVTYLPVAKGKYRNDIVDLITFELKVKKLSLQIELDLLHTPYLCTPVLHGNRFRHVVTLHDVIPMIFRGYRGSLLRSCFLSHCERHIKNADLILTDSVHSQHDIVKHLGISENRVKVVPIAADVVFSQPIDQMRVRETRVKYQLPENFIFYIGGFDSRKNVKVLLEAYAAAKSRGIKETLVLGGAFDPSGKHLRSGLVENIPAVARSLDIEEHVRFIGAVPQHDLPHIYHMARLFVYPSLYEGFGLPPLEAMCCGTPVLASNASSLPEIIDRADLLFEPRNVEILTEKILWLLNDEKQREEVVKWGINRAGAFRWSAAALQTLDLYHAV